jgi:hypothetical protein
MTLDQLTKVLENKIAALNNLRLHAEKTGDAAEMVRLDAEIAETQITLDKLRS